ncbi:hypothetical protein NSQ62_07710 [Solibacillus sp. FSL H8-0523]|uniref:hypothetical protein n=1 Tax=Solibacillus sp. FSL H8-0523 TaxID=2954511 RepID=UPI003100C9A6
MKVLYFGNHRHEAEKIVKDTDSIIGYTEGKEVFSLLGISNFEMIRLEEGQEYDLPTLSIEEQLEELRQENARLSQTLNMVVAQLLPPK